MRVPMSQRVGSPGAPAQGIWGMSWAFLFFLLIVTLGVVGVLLYIASSSSVQLPRLKIYWLIAALSGLLWFPYAHRIHSSKARRLIVYDGPGRLSIYRFGKKAGLHFEGRPVQMISRSGIRREFVTGLDEESGAVQCRQVDGHTALDNIRDPHTFDKLSSMFCDLRDEDRLSRELVAAQVAIATKENSSRWIAIGTASQDPAPIEAELKALGMMPKELEVSQEMKTERLDASEVTADDE